VLNPIDILKTCKVDKPQVYKKAQPASLIDLTDDSSPVEIRGEEIKLARTFDDTYSSP